MENVSEQMIFASDNVTAFVNPKSESTFIFNQQNLADYESGSIQALSYVHQAISSNQKVFNGKLANELKDLVSKVNLDSPVGNTLQALEELKHIYLNNAVYFHNPKYVAHLNCPVAYPSVIAEQILSAINSSLDTYDQSGAGTLMEQKLIDWTCKQIGFNSEADGIFTSGGSQSNLMALLIARDYYAQTFQNTSLRDSGLTEQATRYKIFTSEVSHFSVQKSAAILGLGYDAVVSIPVDNAFKMDIHALKHAIEKTIEEGDTPICVVATAGTTDFGSIDPLHAISQLCKAHNMWMHVDAAYGCGLLVSNQHKTKLNGIENANSVTVDYHKSFLQPVSSSAFFMQNGQHFSLLTHHADYLNPLNTDTEKTPNLVDKSLQTTRRFDALKLWLTLRVMGAEQIGNVFDKVIKLAKQTHAILNQDDEFEVIHQPEISTLVFRFYQKNLPNELLNTVNNQIKEKCFKAGECAIARTKVKGVQYLKFTLLNPTTSIKHISEILSEIKAHAYLELSQQVTD